MAVALAVLLFAAVCYVAVQGLRPVPDPATVRTIGATAQVPGSPPLLPWPSPGQGAIGSPAVGTIGSPGRGRVSPIASLAKMMTAEVVLTDHPLMGDASGPSVTLTDADVANYRAERAAGESAVAVASGETLTERQLLEGLLVGSGDNLATVVANWDAGSVPAFVARMNATAASLGLRQTHYTDPSGLDAQTVGTPRDQLAVAETSMANPVFASIVAQPQVMLPVAGVVYNFNSFVGKDGILGVKTGNSSAAGGCFAFAGTQSVAGRQMIVYGVVMGVRGGPSMLQKALDAGKSLLDATRSSFARVTVLPSGTSGAKVVVPWAAPVDAATATTVTMLGWPGATVEVSYKPAKVRGSVPAGSVVGTLTLRLGSQQAQVSLRTEAAVPSAPLSWRLRQI